MRGRDVDVVVHREQHQIGGGITPDDARGVLLPVARADVDGLGLPHDAGGREYVALVAYADAGTLARAGVIARGRSATIDSPVRAARSCTLAPCAAPSCAGAVLDVSGARVERARDRERDHGRQRAGRARHDGNDPGATAVRPRWTGAVEVAAMSPGSSVGCTQMRSLRSGGAPRVACSSACSSRSGSLSGSRSWPRSSRDQRESPLQGARRRSGRAPSLSECNDGSVGFLGAHTGPAPAGRAGLAQLFPRLPRVLRPSSEVSDWVALTNEPLPTEAALAWATTPSAGAIVTFSGVVRDHADGRDGVRAMTYEAYDEPATRAMNEIVAELRRRWPDVQRVAVLHRVGELALSEASVLVVVSAPHRRAAFDAAAFAIDTLKESVPIWKQEHWSGGSDWAVEQHAIRPVAPR